MFGRIHCHAGIGALCSALGLLTPATGARAHGEPPTAHAVVREDAEGPLLVKLGIGFAAREEPGRFRYLCPALWAGEYTAPAAALPDGTVVIGADSGLMLLAPDGTLTRHPDPLAEGFSTELVVSHGGVFALRFKQGKSEVLAVDAVKARVVWSDSRVWYSLAPLAHGLVLLRSQNALLDQLTLSFEGALLDSQQASSPRSVDYVFARGLAEEAYALLLSQSSPELGRIQGNTFTRVALAASSIAGPIITPQGALLAVDGQLQRLDGASLSPLADPTYVGCLERHEHGSYACTREGVSRLGPEGVGEQLFSLAWLVPPDFSQLSDEKARARCDYQWQDLRFDLLALGVTLDLEDEFAADAGRGDEFDAGVGEDEADASEEPPASAKSSSRCALRPAASAEAPWSWGLLGLGLCGLALRRRRQRR
ncbi:MAG TPA: hypothetical protein VFZ61_06630 [Polyangiales bacterium]